MEIGAREAFQFLSVIAALAGAFAVCRSQLARVVEDLKGLISSMHSVEQRLDDGQASMAVFKAQIEILGEINSPGNLERRHTSAGLAEARLQAVQARVEELVKQHNGSHPVVKR